jgi:hypothetical protein
MLRSLILSTFLLTVQAQAATEYGQFSKGSVTSSTLKDALASFKNQPQQLLQVSGTVKKVCAKKGCWMTLDDQGTAVRVEFKGYSFFVPARLENKKVLVEGKILEKKRSVGEQKHLLEDAGASQEEIANIKESKIEYTFEAAGVRELAAS